MRMPTRFRIRLLLSAGMFLLSAGAYGAAIDNGSVSPDNATANSVYIYKVRFRDPQCGVPPTKVRLRSAGVWYDLDPNVYDGTDIMDAGVIYSVRLTAGLDLRRDPNRYFDNDDQEQKTQGTRYNGNLTAKSDGNPETYLWRWEVTHVATCTQNAEPQVLDLTGTGPTVHDTIWSSYVLVPDPDPAAVYYLGDKYGARDGGKDWMTAYPINWPVEGWWEDPLEVTPYVEQFPDEGTTSSTYIFRIHYLNEDNLPPSPWVTNAMDPWNFGADPGKVFESGVMVYLRNIDTGDLFHGEFHGHHMFPIDPGDTGYDSYNGVPFILRVGPVGGIEYTGSHTRSTLAWTASTNHYYEALPPGRYEYFFACSDDVYSAFEGQKDWVWPTLDDLPALPVPQPPYDATGWFGYRGLNWPTGIMTRYNETTKQFQDYVCGFVDKATYFPGIKWNYFLFGPYPYDSWSGWGTSTFPRRVSYPQVDPGLYEIGFSAGQGRTRFLGTLDPYKRAVNPRIGNQDSSYWRMWAETAGGTDKDVFTFQANYWQSNGEKPIYVRVYINNDWNGDDPNKPFRSYDMQVYPAGYEPTRDDFKTGVLYRVQLSVGDLGYGPHCYYFETSDPQWFDSARNVWVGSRVCRYPRRLDTISYDGSSFFDFNLPNAGDVGGGMPTDNDFINGPYINTRCVLSKWSVTPTIGPGGTDFVFSITYTDADNQLPYQPHVIIQLADGYFDIDGVHVVRCNMVKADPIRDGWVPGLVIPADNLTRPYDQGVVYLFHTSSVPDLRLQPGTRKHYFEFIDDWGRQSDQNDLIKGEVVRKPDSTWFDGPQVTANIVPSLFDGKVESADGTHDNATLWSFKVKYRDGDDQSPVYILVFLGVLESSGIVWDAGHQMLAQNPADTVYSDGREYYYSTRLSGSTDGKQYYYCFVASDGVDRAEYNATTSPSSGMVWFPNRIGSTPKGEILDPEPGSTTVFLFDHFPVVNNVPASPLNPAFYQNPLLYQNGTPLSASQYSLIPDDGKLILVNPATGEITASYFFGTAHPEKVNITNPPYLRDAVCTPPTGETTTMFTYEITYADTDGPNGQAPSGVYVVIDGVRQLMTPKTTSRSYSSGVRYQYKTTLSSGAHTYYFEASDGVAFAIYDAEGEKRSNTQISGKVPISGPYVNDRPTLTDGEIDPPSPEIDISQSVTYLITYADIDNEGPNSGYPVVYVDNPNEIDYDGMVTAVTDNSIQDNTQNWPVNTFAGKPVQMTSGTNPTVFKIESNTSNTLVLVDNDVASKVSLGDTFSITKLRMVKSNADDQNFADGCIYEVSVPGLGEGTHGAHFKSVTLEQEMPGVTRTTTVRFPVSGPNPPYLEMPGPTVKLIAPPGNVAPVLSEPNLTPATGSSSTLFTFSVKYQDTNGDSPNQPHDNVIGHIRLVLDGVNYDMATPDIPNWVTGETCTYTVSGLTPGPHYYYFSASDGWVTTRLPASPADQYVMYISRPPVLSEGTVVPMTGNAGRSYEYQVRYKDPDGQPPTSLKVVIDGEEKEIGVPIPGGDYMNVGVVYSYPLPAGTATVADHTFYFSATDGNGYAVFDYDLANQTTRSRSSSSPITDIDGIPGPYIHDSTAPTLSAGAVQPLNGWESDTFVYSVIYTDAENDEPEYVKVYIDGSSDAHAFALTKDPNKDDYSTGVTYTLSKAGLPAGSHTYYFTASDYLAVARLPASGVLGGPNVVARQPATITIDYTPASPSIGSSVEVSGKVTDPQARALSVPLKIKRTSPNGTIVEIDQQSGVDGTYSYSWIPDVTGKWKVKVTWIGDSHFLPSESPEITIEVGGPSFEDGQRKEIIGVDMISIPFQLSTGFPDGVFGTQPPFALAKWIPSLAAYKMYSLLPQYTTDFDFPMIATGHSYWIKTLQSKTIRPSGRLITSTTYSVVLGVGWNQVGCPYTFQVNWSSLKVRYNDLTVSLVEAANNGWIRPFGWTYDYASHGYSVVDANRSGAERVMRPWRGYWMKALVNCTLIIPGATTSQSFTPTSTDSLESSIALGSTSSVAKWEVRIGARNGKLSDDSNYFGVSRSKADRMESPAMLENYVDLYFTDKDGGVYASDLKTDASVKDGWQFNVTTDTPGEIELTWDGMESVPDDVRLVLVDTAENKPVDLVPGGSYKFDMAQGEADRSFRILYQSR